MLHRTANLARSVLKRALPSFVLVPLRNYRIRRIEKREYANLSTRQIFTRIYAEGTWGRDSANTSVFFSGTGSRTNGVVDPYVRAAAKVLADIAAAKQRKPDAVDLGCGDFHVGAQLRPHCGSYTACDIVEPLITYNKEKFRHLDVDFLQLDLVVDPLPSGDIVFLRQVLQHLSNKQISAALPRLFAKYEFILVTEHLPATEPFRPNLDKPTGANIRPSLSSGVVLTQPPFNISVKQETRICEVTETPGIVRTCLYRRSEN